MSTQIMRGELSRLSLFEAQPVQATDPPRSRWWRIGGASGAQASPVRGQGVKPAAAVWDLRFSAETALLGSQSSWKRSKVLVRCHFPNTCRGMKATHFQGKYSFYACNRRIQDASIGNISARRRSLFQPNAMRCPLALWSCRRRRAESGGAKPYRATQTSSHSRF